MVSSGCAEELKQTVFTQGIYFSNMLTQEEPEDGKSG